MLTIRSAAGIVSATIAASGVNGVCAQAYPAKPIRFVTTGIGGGVDFASRLIAQGLTDNASWQTVVDNRPTGIIAAETVSRAAPDGYTLYVGTGSLWLGPYFQKMPYDPVKDFAPISLTNQAPNLLIVHPSLPVKTVKELITLAKARPRELNYASTAIGSTNHLAAELFKHMAGVDIVRIPFKSSGTATNALLGGEVQLNFGTAGSIAPHVKSGRLRALAVTSDKPSALFPGMPTVAATGLPGYESSTMTVVFAPAATPAALTSRLNQEIVRTLQRPDVKEKFMNSGVEPVGTTPEEAAAKIKSEMQRMGKLIKDAGMRLE